MHSYLSERKQCVKVGVDFSAWKNIIKVCHKVQYLSGTICASLSLFGNEAFSIVLFISIVIGLLTIGFAIFKIFTEIPSLPKQCVKVGVDFSTWKNIYKGVPCIA
jgi:hypothetical protein